MKLRRLSTGAPDFDAALAELTRFEAVGDPAVEAAVRAIVANVRARGDAALLEYTRRFDRVAADYVAALEVPRAALGAALDSVPGEQAEALREAAARVRRYHERQAAQSWQYEEADGTLLGQQVTPLERVGLYVPGGKAAYPSTVLMNAIPAKVAGVRELVMVSPTPGGERNPLVLAAAQLAGVDRVISIGGAQAIAALAYGTECIPRVHKIVGPGNAYVAAAKRLVFGQVGIDMIAGPSEILVLCDGRTDPDWIAMDLFSQAEHDELAQAILVSPDAAFLDAVERSIARLLPQMPRREVIQASLGARGAFVQTRDLEEACAVANRIAPEHLELSVEDPQALLPKLHHAGAIFMGRYSSEAVGDYCAGPNHVLPTSGTARFSSPLGVYDFQKRTSLIGVSRAGATTLGRVAATLARGEGLPAHARSAEYRIENRGQTTISAEPKSPLGDSAAPKSPLGDSVAPKSPLGDSAEPKSPLGDSAEPKSPLGDSVAPKSPVDGLGRNRGLSPDSLVRSEILALKAYHVAEAEGMVKLDAMENPYTLPAPLRRELGEALARVDLNRYPEPTGRKVRELVARRLGVPQGMELVLGNGSDDLIQMVTLALARPGATMLFPDPTFVMYQRNATLSGVKAVGVPLRPDFALDRDAFLAQVKEHRPALVFIAFPNNPTGVLYPEEDVEAIIQASEGLVVLDEAYHVFAQKSFLPRLAEFRNLVVMRTVSKLGLAGIRLGYLAGRPEWIAQINKVRQVYNVNVLTQATALFVLERLEVLEEQAARIRADRAELGASLAGFAGVTVVPSQANFFLVRVPDADRVYDALRRQGVLVRNFNGSHPLLVNCLRITVGTAGENRILLTVLREALR